MQIHLHLGVSRNRGIPQWMVYNGKTYWNGWYGGTPISEASICEIGKGKKSPHSSQLLVRFTGVQQGLAFTHLHFLESPKKAEPFSQLLLTTWITMAWEDRFLSVLEKNQPVLFKGVIFRFHVGSLGSFFLIWNFWKLPQLPVSAPQKDPRKNLQDPQEQKNSAGCLILVSLCVYIFVGHKIINKKPPKLVERPLGIGGFNPFRKIGSSIWIHFTQASGVKIPKIFELPVATTYIDHWFFTNGKKSSTHHTTNQGKPTTNPGGTPDLHDICTKLRRQRILVPGRGGVMGETRMDYIPTSTGEFTGLLKPSIYDVF